MNAPVVIDVGGDYEVTVGRGLRSAVADALPPGVATVALVRSDALARLAEPVAAALRDAGYQVIDAPVPDAESAKSAAVVASLWDLLGEHALTRSDAVVAVGGGTVTDLAGFVAATWLRGIAIVQVPTTLLAMVDAAVGGKTGINTAAGKNLVGAFYPPAAVLCDLDTLETLPRADYIAGLAEVIKAGFIADPTILDLIESDPKAATRWDSPMALELIERAVRVKAAVVSADLKESYLREILNYGHTLGHAIERVEGYRRRHGEAVAIGMMFAAELAREQRGLSEQLVDRHRRILTLVSLPTTYPGMDFDGLMDAMRLDKKNRGSLLRFVVLEGLGVPTRLEGPSREALRGAFDRIVTAP